EETDTNPAQELTSRGEPLWPIAPAQPESAMPNPTLVATWLNKRTRRALLVVASIVLVGGATALALYEFSRSGKNIDGKRTMKITRVTNSGKVGTASISPDGRFITYDENYTSGKGTLYVRQVGTNNEIQLLDPDQRFFGGTAFSPDGGLIYYVCY